MSTHTHRGHCQVCLRIQAIDTATGRVAVHGYRVKHGFFSGRCPGSESLSLHVERTITDGCIAHYQADAKDHAIKAQEYKDGKRLPEQVRIGERRIPDPNNRGRVHYEDIIVPYAEAAELYQLNAVRVAIYKHESAATEALRMKNMMQEWAARVFDNKTPAYRVEDLEVRDWKVGDTVRIGGKKGFTATIEAIEDKPYKTRGFGRGSETIMCPHARITQPGLPEIRTARTGIITREARPAKQYWEPLRHIKRPKSALIESLKKANLL
jgi:hypothetical protein